MMIDSVSNKIIAANKFLIDSCHESIECLQMSKERKTHRKNLCCCIRIGDRISAT